MELIHPIFKWLHILFGVLWIGLLYFFNWVNGPFVATLDGETKKKVVPELLPRALYFFRWGAAWTWITGVILLTVLFHHGGQTFDVDRTWGTEALLMIAVTFLGVFIYDYLYKSNLVSNVRVMTVIMFVLIGVVVYLMKNWAGFSYRSFNIHLGALLGTNMAFNVWFRIWPSQQKIITAIKNGTAPDAQLVALAGLRSKHNTYMSVPLLWTMINQHTEVFAGGKYGVAESTNWLVLMVVIALSWHIVWQFYKRAGKVKGF